MWKSILKAPAFNKKAFLQNDTQENLDYMLSDKTWRAAGGNRNNNRTGKMDKDGFSHASLDEIEEILGRPMVVSDFSSWPINWSTPEGPVFNRIGLKGQKELAKEFILSGTGNNRGSPLFNDMTPSERIKTFKVKLIKLVPEIVAIQQGEEE
tara:strand:+ start:342 stop:797 length:456 start_codon:yes stop_codon:yes gene_type:complete